MPYLSASAVVIHYEEALYQVYGTFTTFMVRGISMRWKQPVGHFFTGTSVNADVLKSMIITRLAKLESIGLRMAAIMLKI